MLITYLPFTSHLPTNPPSYLLDVLLTYVPTHPPTSYNLPTYILHSLVLKKTYEIKKLTKVEHIFIVWSIG
jgi:hypothetical protein